MSLRLSPRTVEEELQEEEAEAAGKMKVMTPPPTTTWLYVLRAPTVSAAMWPVGLWANKRKREGSILVATDGRRDECPPNRESAGEGPSNASYDTGRSGGGGYGGKTA